MFLPQIIKLSKNTEILDYVVIGIVCLMSQLRSLLESRTMDVLHSTADTALSNLKIFLEFLESNLLLKSILDELKKDLPDAEPLIADIKTKRRIRLPSSYLEKVKACFSILQNMIEKNEEPWGLMSFVSALRNVDAMTQETLRQFFVPVAKYIDAKVISIDSFQYLLLRFKLKSEWFDKEHLFKLYNSNTTKGESILDNVLRAYLFDQGINFPFSKPSSPSGEVDVLPVIEQKPIPLEIKVFDGDGRSKSHVRQGFTQAFNYAKDYGESSAYLVIFNVSQYQLMFKLSSQDIPQRLVIGDKTIYVFIINLYPHDKPASKMDLKPYEIDEKYLLKKQD